MGKSKSFKTDKEFSRNKELSHKNKELQRELSKLRKSLDKLKYGWCPKCMGVGDTHNNSHQETVKLPKKRSCYDCGKADLILVRYHKPDGVWYYRACPVCGKRTRGKKLTDDVED